MAIIVGIDLRGEALERYRLVRDSKKPADEPTTKICTKCGANRPISEYYVDRASRDGLERRCNDCCAKERAAERAETAEDKAKRAARKAVLDARRAIEAAVPEGMRRCRSCCRVLLASGNFHCDATQAGGRSWQCHDCRRESRNRRRADSAKRGASGGGGS